MAQIFCMLFPPLLFNSIYFLIKKTSSRFSDYLLNYCWFTISINFFTFVILSALLNNKQAVFTSFQLSDLYAIKYITVSIMTAEIILVVLYLIQNPPKPPITALLEIIGALILLLSFILYFATDWVQNNFNNISVEQIIFHINVSLKGANTDYKANFIEDVLIPSLILTLSFFIIFWQIEKLHFKTNAKWRFSIVILVFISSFFRSSKKLDLGEYLSYAFTDSSFIEKNYADPLKTNISFPEKKRNLIYIFLESMENTYMSEDLGGAQQTDLIPELSALAKEHTSFSNHLKLGGALPLSNTQWTIGAMVAQHTGLPLKLPMGDDYNNDYGEYKSFLPGAVSLGDILEKEGYQQMIMIGSEIYFGGRKEFFTQHGNYQIFDYDTAKANKRFDKDYYVWWGFEDLKLFQYAKEELCKLSESEQPFNFTMLTVDTHSNDGYVCDACGNTYDEPYANVISCSSRQIGEFIFWIQSQDFYENTTIVIAGDHLSMDVNFFGDLSEDYVRTTYNVYINPSVQTSNTKNRLFGTVDLFPTTLASMGVTIEGDRLGLGTNLFSNTPTLIETYGLSETEDGFRYKSSFYNETFIFEH